ncbi:MAG: hypothetical protein IJB79_02165 [Candidatus Gastranaerophilales bacterium]|nr:hypothetical protein [Candidatus Gastranaerophilales bacterium]
MSFEDFNQFQEELERAQKEQEELSKLNKKKEEGANDWGFGEVLKERQKHKDALRERLLAQNFSEKEIEKLFKIISKAEEEMEEVKSKFDYKAKIRGSGVKLHNDLIEIQNKMKKDFDEEFNQMLKNKKGNQ